ncbi:MAG: hypothetical protein JSW70_09015 [Syntrophobacterales bacterium]|nr:MAG: hypothetical protein JSW70_09015 [Syntrophobacterales bacterium]
MERQKDNWDNGQGFVDVFQSSPFWAYQSVRAHPSGISPMPSQFTHHPEIKLKNGRGEQI